MGTGMGGEREGVREIQGRYGREGGKKGWDGVGEREG